MANNSEEGQGSQRAVVPVMMMMMMMMMIISENMALICAVLFQYDANTYAYRLTIREPADVCLLLAVGLLFFREGTARRCARGSWMRGERLSVQFIRPFDFDDWTSLCLI
jgi:hypothetical protein